MHATAGLRGTAILLLIAWVSALIGLAVLITGGLSFHLGSVVIRAHNPWPALLVTLASVALAWRRGAAPVTQALALWWDVVERRASMLAAAAAGLAITIGLVWGTYAAGGSDSYCYLNQAEMLAAGRVHQAQPIVSRAPWPNAPMTFTPVGHLPVPRGESPAAIVPACPTGYPLLLAAARLAGGRTAMFWVVPIFGGLAIWWTFLLGRHVAGGVAGVAAAWLLAASPTFLYQITQPMTDVPALALWTAALVSVLRQQASVIGGLRSGLWIGAALLVRPNLVPLVAIMACAVLIPERRSLRDAVRSLIGLGLGSLPGILIILALNHAMFGGALQSGYGKLADLFTIAHVRGNLGWYPVWLVQTQTWFLRFVLPAFPPLLVLSSGVAIAGVVRLPAAWRTIAFVTATSVLVGFQVMTAEDRAVFRLRDLERRFRDAGEYVARRLPANAVVLAATESGSVRFYSGRQTLRWSVLDPAWLDRAMAFLEAEGYRPFLLFERDEEADFRQTFEPVSRWGSLAWPPMADIDHEVHIYDPADLARYLRGETIATDDVWPRGR